MSIVDAKFEDTAAPSNLAAQQLAPVAQRLDIDARIQDANDFESLKARLLQPFGRYTNNIQGKDRVNADGWQRIASALAINTKILTFTSEGNPGAICEIDEDSKGKRIVSYTVTVRAWIGDRTTDDMGTCDSTETKHAQNKHKMKSVALTRAKNRAICALVGGSPSDIAEEQEERVNTRRGEVAREEPSGPMQVPVPELIRLHAAAGAPMETLGAWLQINVAGFNGKSLTPAQSLLARDRLLASGD